MHKLIAGVEQFRRSVYPLNRAFFEQLASRQQNPLALFITCSDSRVNPNLITQSEPGDLFLIRNAGNLVPPYSCGGDGESATIEYSVEVLGIRNIIVCGHSQCGAIQALLNRQSTAHLPAVNAWCAHAEATRRIVMQKHRSLDPPEVAVAATQENVLVQMNHLPTHPCVAARLASGELRIHGWYYDIGMGQVLQFDASRGGFTELEESAMAARTSPFLDAAVSTVF